MTAHRDDDLQLEYTAQAEAVAAVEAAAHERWKATAFIALERVARRQQSLITDDVWNELLVVDPAVQTRDNRAMGPILLRGQREQLIRPTPNFAPSARVGCHANWVRVWESCVQGVPALPVVVNADLVQPDLFGAGS